MRIGVYKTLDILHPNYFIPMHSGSNESHYTDFNLALSEAGYDLNMFAPMDKGDRFTYRKKKQQLIRDNYRDINRGQKYQSALLFLF